MSWKKGFIAGFVLALWVLPASAQVKRTFPKSFKKLYLGMSMEEFALARKQMDTERLSRDKFRYRWMEEESKGKGIGSVVYYFADGEKKAFYEAIIYYTDLKVRDKWLAKYYGPPNHKNNTEWRFASDQGFEVHAWRYEDRLVIAAAMPGTEWEEK